MSDIEATVALSIAKLNYLSDILYQLYTVKNSEIRNSEIKYKIIKTIIKTPKTDIFKEFVNNMFSSPYWRYSDIKYNEIFKSYLKYDLKNDRKNNLSFNLEENDLEQTRQVIKEIDAIYELIKYDENDALDARIRGLIVTAKKTDMLKDYIEKYYAPYVIYL